MMKRASKLLLHESKFLSNFKRCLPYSAPLILDWKGGSKGRFFSYKLYSRINLEFAPKALPIAIYASYRLIKGNRTKILC